MELRLLQRKIVDLEQRLAEERRSHDYFKSRLATIKSKQPGRAEKAAWIAEKEHLLEQQEYLTEKVHSYSKQCERATSCRLALLDALSQSQQEVADAKDKLRKAEERVPDCVICFEDTVSMVFVPCGHACVCDQCAQLVVDECPLCRGVVDMKIKLHFA